MNTKALPARARAANSYFINAIPHHEAEGWFVGEYGIPGMQQGRPRDANGDVAVFGSAEAAKIASAETLIDLLNTRGNILARDADLEREVRLTHNEFAVALAEAGLGPTLFAYIYGTTTSRVLQWIDGRQMIPHPVRILLELFKRDAKNLDLAEQITRAVVYKKEQKPRSPKEPQS